jgi:hypothetical protein
MTLVGGEPFVERSCCETVGHARSGWRAVPAPRRLSTTSSTGEMAALGTTPPTCVLRVPAATALSGTPGLLRGRGPNETAAGVGNTAGGDSSRAGKSSWTTR